MSGFAFKLKTESKYIRKALLMENIAAIPGIVESFYMHIRSVVLLKRDKGWIHHMLEESDNERFHFITFVQMKQPEILLRIFMVMQQLIFGLWFFLSYLISPRYCHKFVGYLE